MQARKLRDIGRAVKRHRARWALIGLAAAGSLLLLLAAAGDGGETDPEPGGAGGLISALRERLLDPAPAAEPPPEVSGPRYAIAKVRTGRNVPLHRSPGGPVFAEAGERTEFGSERSFWIARSRGGWLGVPVPELPNGELAWIRDDATRLERLETRYWIVADISARMVELRYGDRVLDRFPVTVGAPGSPTPTGAYAVTDGLAGASLGPYYGCCILALSGHQPNLPPDWLGGDRIGIHGTPGSTGGAESAGCLRAADEDMVGLFARVPLGAPVFIRA